MTECNHSCQQVRWVTRVSKARREAFSPRSDPRRTRAVAAPETLRAAARRAAASRDRDFSVGEGAVAAARGSIAGGLHGGGAPQFAMGGPHSGGVPHGTPLRLGTRSRHGRRAPRGARVAVGGSGFGDNSEAAVYSVCDRRHSLQIHLKPDSKDLR